MLEFMLDFRFHSAKELDAHLGANHAGEWVACIRQLIELGYSFSRRRSSFMIRKRYYGEQAQDIGELTRGVDVMSDEDMNPGGLRRPASAIDPMLMGYAPVDVVSPAAEGGPPYSDGVDDFHAVGAEDAGVVPHGQISISLEPAACLLPASTAVTSTKAVLARKRTGKSYLSMVIAEEFLKRGLPFAVLDPTGIWWGLGARRDGTPSDFKVCILGGQRGRFRLVRDGGALAADAVMAAWPVGMIFDLSDMLPEDQHEFVADFGARLYAKCNKPVHVFIDEADEFVPQNVDSNYKHQKRACGVIDRLVRRGGIKGIGSTLITQRPAVIHKNVLSQVDGIFALSMSAPHDLEAFETWLRPVVQSANDRHHCLTALPLLPAGEAFYTQNTNKGAPPLVRFQVREKETYDSGRTPTMDDPTPGADVIGLASLPDDVVVAIGDALDIDVGDPNEDLDEPDEPEEGGGP